MGPRSRAWRVLHRIGLALFALGLAAGCGAQTKLPSPVLIDAGDQPALFLSSAPDAAQIGYLSGRVPLQITGRSHAGRVPVRVDGALRTRGFVNERLLALRVQRRGRLRGTPLYLGPDDVVLVSGSDANSSPPGATREGERQRVRAQARLRGQPFGASYEGSYPRAGLSASSAPADAQPPDPGSAYTVPANTVVPLFEAPHAAAVAELPAEREAYVVQVVNRSDSWLAVRAGEGPYLIGWTPSPLQPALAPPLPQPTLPEAALRSVNGVQLPARLANEPGALKRVAAGARVVFGDVVIGVLARPGYARVVRAYDAAGYADVFVAADDDVALRGLVRTADLSDPPAISGTASPVAAR